jgi:pimeloyl-ACP methyl ester carboxylesterase
MRRVTTLALIAGATLAVVGGSALARSRMRGRATPLPKLVTGVFPNGMAYARWGTGPTTLLMIPGGPGNAMPRNLFLSWLLRPLRPLVQQGYTIWMVMRKQGMPTGHTFADMADDYGQLIADEFGGKVDVVLGISTGGQIGFYVAARHPDRFDHIVIAVAGYEDGERAKEILRPYARLAGEGRMDEAMASMFEVLYPSLPRGVARVLGAVQGRLMYGATHASFASDVMVEAEAELACDAREVLPAITVPLLLVCGDRDEGFSKEVYEETARLIPGCTLRMYEGSGHMGVTSDRRFAQDLLEFVRRRPAPRADRDAASPTGGDQATAIDAPATPTPALAGSARG